MNKNAKNINELKELLDRQAKQQKNAYKRVYVEALNSLLINALDNVDAQAFEVEQTATGVNRGVLVECLVKYQVYEYLGINKKEILKSQALTGDLDLRKYDKEVLKELNLENKLYEIKFISKIANAHGSNHNNKNYIIVDLKKRNSVYLVNKDNLILDKTGHVVDFANGIELSLLNELIGFEAWAVGLRGWAKSTPNNSKKERGIKQMNNNKLNNIKKHIKNLIIKNAYNHYIKTNLLNQLIRKVNRAKDKIQADLVLIDLYKIICE